MMRVLVAGGSGVIGRAVVSTLVARGHQVSATTTDPRSWDSCSGSAPRGCTARRDGDDLLRRLAGGVDHHWVPGAGQPVGVHRANPRSTYPGSRASPSGA